MKNKNHKPGFSLIEMLVSVSIFTVIMMSSMDIFKMVIESQRGAIATQNVEESLKYFFEVTAKEIRMAQRNKNLFCTDVDNNAMYNSSTNSLGDILYFKNYHNECVKYSLVSDQGINRFAITRGGVTDFISPAKINISYLRFILKAEGGGNFDQPSVTMEIVANAIGKESSKSEMRVQTTLTSRYYKAK